GHAAVALTVRRQKGDVVRHRAIRAHQLEVERHALHAEMSVRAVPGAEEEVGDVLEARPDQAGEAQDLAVADVDVDVLENAPAEAAHLDVDLVAARARIDRKALELAADDHLDELALARLPGVHGSLEPAVAEHGHAVRDLPDLVEVVRDEQHARV